MATPSSICYSIFASTFAAAAFILCWAAGFGCEFISFTSTSGFSQPVTFKFGIWTGQFWSLATTTGGSYIFETCHRYSGVEIDPSWRAARVFSLMALGFGGIFLFSNVISSYVSPLRNTSRFEAYGFVLACIFQGLSLLLLNSALCKDNILIQQIQVDEVAVLGRAGVDFPDTCSLGRGANCAIAAAVFWCLAALISSMATLVEKREPGNNPTTEPLITDL